MKQVLLSLVAVTWAVCCCSCAENVPLEEVKEKKEIEPQRDKMVARVASVNKAANYVLIQRFGRLVVPENAILYTLGIHSVEDNSAASIKVTGERLGQFLAADILSGELAVGDAVYLRTFEEGDVANNQ